MASLPRNRTNVMRKQEGNSDMLSNRKNSVSNIKKRNDEVQNILFYSIYFFSISCSNNKQIKFDKNKWNEQADPALPSPYRNKMVTELMSNYKLVGFKYSELIELLGVPDYKDSSSLVYKIIVDYGHDIDPVYTKNLDFTFSKDSVIVSFKVDEWKK